MENKDNILKAKEEFEKEMLKNSYKLRWLHPFKNPILERIRKYREERFYRVVHAFKKG